MSRRTGSRVTDLEGHDMLVAIAVTLVSTTWLLLMRRRAELARSRSKENALRALGEVVERVQQTSKP